VKNQIGIKTKVLFPSLAVALLLLSSCSWIESYNLRTDVQEQVEKDFEKTLEKEADENLNPGNNRKADYIKFVQLHSHVEIKNIKKVSEKDLLVSIKFHTVAGEARQTLLAVMKPLEGRTLNAFNFSEAISAIHMKQPELKIESDQELQITVHR
jgi:hypothetical protein